MTDSSAIKQQGLGTSNTAGERWHDYVRDHPVAAGVFTDEPIEIMRLGWDAPLTTTIDGMRPEFNVAGLMWRRPIAPAAPSEQRDES